jgi:TP901 family phage tail tape measure protein
VSFKLAEAFVEIGATTAALDRTLTGVKAKLTGAVKGAGAGFASGIAGSLGMMGAVGAGLMAAIGLKSAFAEAVELEAAFGQVKKFTGLADDEFATLKANIVGMAGTMGGVSLEEMAGIAAMAGRLGIGGVENLTEYTQAIALVSIALDDIPAEEAATNIARILNNFSRGPEDALSFASALNILDATTTATGRDILDVTRRLSGAAATLGMSPQETLALAATIKDAGISTEIGGTAFSQVLTKMVTDQDKFAAAAGMSKTAFSKLLDESPLEALKAVVLELNKLGKQEAIQAVSDLGLDGVRTAGSLLQLAKVIDKMDESLARANDDWITHASILEENRIKQAQFGTQWERFTNVLNGFATELGDIALPSLTSILSQLTDATSAAGAAMSATARSLVGAVTTISGPSRRLAGSVLSGIAGMLGYDTDAAPAENKPHPQFNMAADALRQAAKNKEDADKLADFMKESPLLSAVTGVGTMPFNMMGDKLTPERESQKYLAEGVLSAAKDRLTTGLAIFGALRQGGMAALGMGLGMLGENAAIARAERDGFRPQFMGADEYSKAIQQGAFSKKEDEIAKNTSETVVELRNVKDAILNNVKGALALFSP